MTHAGEAMVGVKDWGALIGGQWRPAADGATFTVFEPATGEPMCEVVDCTAEDVDAAVKAARAAYEEDWRHRTARERGNLLIEIAALIREHADELAELEARDVGKPLSVAAGYDLKACGDTFAYFGGMADKLAGEFLRQGPIDAFTIPEPFGVVAGIIPFNWPPIHVAGKAGPALAAGNTIVLKPSEQAPLSVMRVAELMEEVLPAGVVNVVPGGPRAGAAVAAHKGIGMLSFTGSTATGRHILRSLADNLTPALVELGGKNPFVVFEDADLDRALVGAIEGMFFNQGEACSAASRLLVQSSIKDAFVERYAAAVERLVVGDPLVEGVDVGPMVTKQQQERVLGYIDLGEQEGERLAQAPLPDDPRLAGGYFAPPTLFGSVDPSARIAQEEVFGPVCVVHEFGDYDEAIEIANCTDFGLVSSVYSESAATAQRAAHDIEAGVVMVNNYNRGYLGTPFGGVKDSGYGREHALETIRQFVRVKNVRTRSETAPMPEWPSATRLVEEVGSISGPAQSRP